MTILALKKKVKFYLELVKFLQNVFRRIHSFHADEAVREKLLLCLNRLVNALATEGGTKSTADSKQIYDSYDDRELRDNYDGASELMLVNDKAVVMSHKERRDRHLQYLFEEIDRLLENQATVSILEVGCGNLMNVYETVKVYGDRVSFLGIDIAQKRIDIGLAYFNGELNPNQFAEKSITANTGFADRQFDIVFTMHCLEQIAYETRDALREMSRICRHRIVMIEPVYENGSFLQRTYLMMADHTRILFKSIRELNLAIIVNRVCPVQTNLENQSTLLILESNKN